MVKQFSIYTFLILIGIFATRCAKAPVSVGSAASKNEPISIQLSKESFNPSLGQKIKFQVHAPSARKLCVSICDAHGLSVRTLHTATLDKKAVVKLEWDGKDDSGTVVPDEAYTIKVQAILGDDTLTYDPPLFSGGQTFTITDPQVDMAEGTITYALKHNARMMIRVGQKKGLMLRSVIHGAPKLKGTVTDYWNGKGPDNLLSAKDLPSWAMMIAGYTLPDHSIITYGNTALNYSDYFIRRFPQYVGTMDFPNTSQAFRDTLAALGRKVNLHFAYPLSKDHAPNLIVNFPNAKDTAKGGVPILKGIHRMYIDIDPEDKLFLREQQFEMCFFLDGEFISEDEIGYVPYNWIWNTTEVPEGEHIVTVNVASFKDQIGTKSLKVVVKHQ